jgi:hypothetical protein
MIMQLLRSHAKAIMPPKGMWSKLMKLKNINCCYVSALEATWRIFKFDMYERFPTVERLQYHLPNQQMVMFDNDDDVEEVATQSAISRTMHTKWFKTNQESEVA